MSELKIGDKVRILSVYVFNERFVKVGDEATVIDITPTSIVLDNPRWEYTQFTGMYSKNLDWGIVGESK